MTCVIGWISDGKVNIVGDTATTIHNNIGYYKYHISGESKVSKMVTGNGEPVIVGYSGHSIPGYEGKKILQSVLIKHIVSSIEDIHDLIKDPFKEIRSSSISFLIGYRDKMIEVSISQDEGMHVYYPDEIVDIIGSGYGHFDSAMKLYLSDNEFKLHEVRNMSEDHKDKMVRFSIGFTKRHCTSVGSLDWVGFDTLGNSLVY